MKYVRLNGSEHASELEKVRLQMSLEGGLNEEEFSQLEVSMLIAFVSNTVPATFWVLYDLYSRPQLLDEIRKEMEANALSIKTDSTYHVDIAAIRGNCPLLLSTFQEVLRTRGAASPMRFIMKDTLLAGKYLLKAGNIVNLPSDPIGHQPEVWGDTADTFDERRFMRPVTSDNKLDTKKDPRRTGGFMPFGISPVICPGRHFASSEILGLVAMMVLRYDIEPVCGAWVEPRKNSWSIVSLMGAVKDKFPVSVKQRKIYEGVNWDFEVHEGKGQFPLVIG